MAEISNFFIFSIKVSFTVKGLKQSLIVNRI